MNPPRPEPGSGLPAPYEDPWRRLGGDLRAVLASIGLRLRELWRRNGEGDLPRPGAWPASLAPLFWPLLLALVLLAAGALLIWGIPRLAAGLDRPAAAPAPVASRGAGGDWPIPLPPIAPADAPPTPSTALPRAAADEAAPSPSEAAEGPEQAPAPFPAGSADAVAAGTAAPPPDSAIPSPAAGPSRSALRDELLGDDPAAWILELEAIPAQSLLRLHLGGPFAALEEAERRRLVDRWWERCQGLGYERLELLDRDDRLLARPARIGSGMILLDSPSGRR